MTDAPGSKHENLLISKLLAAGIGPEKLTGAAEAARLLCAQMGPVHGTCLVPRSYLDFQHLFQGLAGKPPA